MQKIDRKELRRALLSKSFPRELLATEVSGSFNSIFKLVTDNHGSIEEAGDIFCRSWIDILVLSQHNKVVDDIPLKTLAYSRARGLWIEVMKERRIDTTAAEYRSAFVELSESVEVLDQVKDLEALLDEAMEGLNNSRRKFLYQAVGEGRPIDEVGPPLGFSTGVDGISRLFEVVSELAESLEDKTGESILIPALTVPKRFREWMDQIDKDGLTNSEKAVLHHLCQRLRIKAWREGLKELIPEHVEEEPKEEAKPTEDKMIKPKYTIAGMAILTVITASLSAFLAVRFTEKPAHADQSEQISRANAVEIAMKAVDSAKSEEPEPLVEEVEASAFAVASNGFFISTSSAAEEGSFVSLSSSGEQVTAKVIWKDAAGKVALLRDTSRSAKFKSLPYRLAVQNANLGDELMTFSGHENVELAKAYISSTTELENGILGLQTTAGEAEVGTPWFSSNGNLVGFSAGENTMITSVKVLSILEEYQSNHTEAPLKVRNGNRLYGRSPAARAELVNPFVYSIERNQSS